MKTKEFDYTLDYKKVNLRKKPQFYRVGKGEQGVLLVEPYKSVILPLWRFRTPTVAKKSIKDILEKFYHYKSIGDFVGMDMARKFLQMGFTRSRRYANHPSGKKYTPQRKIIPVVTQDEEKAASARLFKKAWEKVEADLEYKKLKAHHKEKYG